VRRLGPVALVLGFLLVAACGDDQAGDGTVLGAQLDPAVVTSGGTFTLTFPADADTGIDVVLRQDGKAIYVLQGGVDGTDPEVLRVVDDAILTRPAQLIPAAQGEIVVEYRLPEDVVGGDLELCDAEDEQCDPLPVDG
jgi:hypothetical protein